MAVVKTSGGKVVATSGGRVSAGNCGIGAGGFQAGNTCASGGGQARAKAGGEEGPNGEWYPGGAFIATTEMPKAARFKRDQAAKGRKEIEPYKYEVPPAGELAIYSNLGPGVALQVSGKDAANWSVNEAYLRSHQKADDVVVSQAKGMLEKYRTGERYANANQFHQWATYDDVARMAVANMPVAGATLERMAKIRGTTTEDLQKSLGIKRYDPKG